jgi:hypothetical protein
MTLGYHPAAKTLEALRLSSREHPGAAADPDAPAIDETLDARARMLDNLGRERENQSPLKRSSDDCRREDVCRHLVE